MGKIIYHKGWTEEIVEPESEGQGVTKDDFVAYLPIKNYIFIPTREPWTARGVNARLPKVPLFDKDGQRVRDEEGKGVSVLATTWLDQNKAVEQITWVPGFPLLIRDRLVVSGGWLERRDTTILNLYRGPQLEYGDPEKADPWLKHLWRIYPDDAEHIIRWLAHRVQRPGEKINHALLLGGAQGIGKDTLLEPVRVAVGPWNFRDVTPVQMLGRFNGFRKGTTGVGPIWNGAERAKIVPCLSRLR
jgi:hypothetical protein